MGHNFKKHFGQNFLIHQQTANKIASYISNDIKTVIEIGPGDGKLTKALLEKGHTVFSIEIDQDLHALLEEKFSDHQNFNLIGADVLKFDIKTIIDAQIEYAVTGNLPYNISKNIIKKFLELSHKPNEMVFMMQHEVAEDYVALPPQSRFLSNYAQIFSDVEYVYKVKKEQFKPRPKVDGGVLKFKMKENPEVGETKSFIKFLREGFSAPRKTLTNALKNYEKNLIKEFLDKNGLTEKTRAAELSFNHWVKLFNNLR